MSVVSCLYYNISFKKKDTDKVLRELATWGKFEPVEPTLPVFSTKNDVKEKIVKLKTQYEEVLNYVNKKTDFKNKISVSTVEKIFKNIFEDYKTNISKLDELKELILKSNKATELSLSYQEKTKDILILLEKIKEIKQPIFSDLTLLDVKLVSISKASILTFETAANEADGIYWQNVWSSKIESLYLLTSIKDETTIDKKINLSDFKANEIKIEDSLKGYSPSQLYSKITSRLADLKSIEELANQKADAFFTKNKEIIFCVISLIEFEHQSSDLYQYISYYTGNLTVDEAQKIDLLKIDSKQNTYEIYGFIDPEYKQELNNLFKDTSVEVDLLKEVKSSNHKVRTVMKNNYFIKPFEMITKLMGVPSQNEIDPTPFFSPFFVLFFGFALGDGGYGFIMLFIALWALYKMNLDKSMRGFMVLLAMLSVSTIFFGAITGSWFGVNLDIVPGTFGEILRSWKLLDLQKSLIMVLIGSIIVGFIHQIIAILLEIAVSIKNKDYLNAVANPGTWLLLLGSVALRIYVQIIGQSLEVINLAQYFVYFSLVAFSIGQGIKSRPIFLIPIMGLGSLFNITGILSNSLSYARLLAMGLATGVVAGVINLLADLFGGTDSILGIIVMVIVLVLGHTVNIALNILGSFINVLRLQLVEFFPRFFTGQGKEHEPKSLKSNFFELNEKISALYLRNFPIIITNFKK
jgi:V/A-type H+-transporting ATPase subunit I